jgi:tetratricopeptide (TPR) repeat protein
MADPKPNPADPTEEAPKRQASFGKFLRDVLIVFAIGGGALYWYMGHTQTQEQIADLTVEARRDMARHDLPSLREAERQYREILKLDADHPPTLASMARTLYYQSNHGLDTVNEAQTFLQKAIAAGAETPTRYAAEGYLMVGQGRADEAVATVREWIEKGKAAAPVAHALGVAYLAQGQYIEANRIARQAQEADFSSVAIRLTLAEASHRNGEEKSAIKALSGIVRPNINPNHMLSKAWLAALRAKNYGSLSKPLALVQAVKDAEADDLGPITRAHLAWAEGELSMSVGNAKGAIEKADTALKGAPDFPPYLDLKARGLLALGKTEEAMAAYEKAIGQKPLFRGIKWDLAELQSKMGDDSALALVEELEKSDPAKYKGPRYLVFKGEHALRKGNLEDAKELFTQAAEQGDDADILFGLAKVTFQEEKKKNKRADLERVAVAFQTALEKKRRFPELHEYLAGISLWDYQVDAASSEFEQAEKQYKALKLPIPKIIAFYDRTIATFENAKGPYRVRRAAKRKAKEWTERKQQYLQSLQTS